MIESVCKRERKQKYEWIERIIIIIIIIIMI